MNTKFESNGPNFSNDEIDLRNVFKIIWAEKLQIMIITIISAIISLTIALWLPNIYKSEGILFPVNIEGNTLRGMASKLDGLANLTGFSLGGGNDTNKILVGLETLKSRDFFKKFNEKHNILVELMAVKRWDPISGNLIIDETKYNSSNNSWIRSVSFPRKPKPSTQESHQAFLKILSVSQAQDSGLIKIGIEHLSPIFAQSLVELLIIELNNTIRDQDVFQAEKAIEYLTQQINETSIKELKTKFFEMIQSQTEIIMLAKASPQYFLKTIDHPVISEQKIRPNRAIICILGTMLGLFMSIFLVLLKNYFSKIR